MASIIRSPKVSSQPFIVRVDSQSALTAPVSGIVLDTESKVTEKEEMADETPLVSDEKERKILDYARRLESANQAIDELNRELEETREQFAKYRKEAEQLGFESGLEKGQVEAKQVLGEQLQKLDQIVGQAAEQVRDISEIAEDKLVETVYTAVAKIIGRQMNDRSGSYQVIKQVMSELVHSERLLLRVSPEDYQYLEDLRKQAADAGLGAVSRIVADEHIRMGGCILEHDGGTLDARLEVQLQRLKEALISTRQQRRLDKGND